MRVADPTRALGAAALAATGLLHLVLAPEYLDEKAYIGVLFIAGGLVSIALAAAIVFRDDRRALILGALVASGMGVGFILSRTVGLPGYHESEWEVSGLISLALEAAVVLSAMRSGRRGAKASSASGAY